MSNEEIESLDQDADDASEQQHSNVFPLWYIRQLNAKPQTSKFVELVEDDMDFFG